MNNSSKRNISAVIMTFNEEKRIGNCIRSVIDIVEEIIVVDSFSSDKTPVICKNYGVVFLQNKFEGYIQQRKFAISHASNDSVLVLDADEELSEDLSKEVIKIKNNWNADAYAFSRLTNYEGKWIYHCGWYPDKKTRLFDRAKIAIRGKNPHDQIILKEGYKIKWIKKNILHYSYNSISDHITKTNNFSTIAALADFEDGKKASLIYHIIIKPTYQFIYDYFIRLGFLDGYYGIVICIISSFGKYLKYVKLRQLNMDNK